ncbi:hypothetical protein [Nonomuraea typhae]|uniref:Uncharacterized protein n=1 Tax=Nonomuraea typhae TaxID=2603600 RepID=A0ABW7YM14_9ACTN
MSRYLVGPDGLKVVPVQLKVEDGTLLLARMLESTAQPGEVWYKVTRHGMALFVPGYCQLHQLQELVDLTGLREPDESADEETA